MIRKIKKWFWDRFLPMWAKETLLTDNRILQREVENLRAEIEKKDAYIRGLENGIKAQRRIVINTSEVKK
jgi:hypothetical protein